MQRSEARKRSLRDAALYSARIAQLGDLDVLQPSSGVHREWLVASCTRDFPSSAASADPALGLDRRRIRNPMESG
jgi:hypothetical protein